MDTFNNLNNIYKPLCDKSREISDELKKLGYQIRSGFYNNHYVRDGDGFVVEHFPIPVLSISNVGDIGVDVNSVWVEFVVSKDKAVSLDYPALTQAYKVEVYGADDYLHDFYNTESDLQFVVERIQKSNESKICITVTFDSDCRPKELVDLVKWVTKHD